MINRNNNLDFPYKTWTRLTLSLLLPILALTGVYFVTGWIGLLLSIQPGNVSPVWPPAGVGLAAVLLFGWRLTPGIWLGSFLINMVFFYDISKTSMAYFAISCAVSASFGVGSSLQAMLGAALLHRFVGSRCPLDSASEVFKFSAVAMVMCLVAATFGATSLLAAGIIPLSAYKTMWWTWWQGDMVGVLVVTPLALAWKSRRRVDWSSWRSAEFGLLITMLSVVSVVVFGLLSSKEGTGYPLEYLTIPFLVWAAFRFGTFGVTTTISILSVIAIWFTANGLGPFVRESVNTSLLLLQAFMAVITVTALVLAAISGQQKRAELELSQSNEELELRTQRRTMELQMTNEALQTEIAERKQAEETVRQIAAIIASSNDAIIGKTLEGIITSWNKGAERLYGYTAAEAVGQPITLLLPPDRLDEGQWLLEQVRRGERIDHFETERLRKDGQRVKVFLTSSPIKDALGKIIGASTITLDITERKQRDYERLELIFDASPNGTIIVDQQGRMLLVNVQIEEMFGYSRKELLFQPIEMLIPERYRSQHSGYRDGFFSASSARAMGVGRELYGLRKDGTEFPVEIALSPMRIVEGVTAFTIVLSSVVDITERKRLELERRFIERAALLEAANKELEAFAYSVSHDLRAPLRSINGFGQALLKEYANQLDAQGKGYLHRVCDASQRMSELIDDLLNLSRITRVEMRHERVDLSTMAKTIAAKLMETEPERRATFVIAEELIVNGDERLLKIVLENLFDNAWKYTRKHSTARVEFGVTQHQGKEAYFVKDDGIGFDMAYANKLFVAFQRLHSSAEFPGTGIGLATVQRIIHRHGGQVWAEAVVEQGATFYFTL